MLRTKISMLLLAAMVLCIGAGVARAQTPDPENDKYFLNYFAGANGSRPDQTVRITNPGQHENDPVGTNPATTADLCANIYVFRNDQQLAECCSCLVTPNGLRTLSVDFDLTHNPLTPGTVGEGVIKIVPSEVDVDNPASRGGPVGPGGQCLGYDPGTSDGGPISPGAFGTFAATDYTGQATLRAWAVHNQDVSGGLQGSAVNQVTETHFLRADLSEAELVSLQRNCAFIVQQGSGHGLCSCGRGD